MNADANNANNPINGNNADQPQQQAQQQVYYYSDNRPRYRQRAYYNKPRRQFHRYPPSHGFVPFVPPGYDPNQYPNQYPMVHLMEVPPPLPSSSSSPMAPTALEALPDRRLFTILESNP